ncbi:MAG TPA: hypothetical protein VMT21_04135, partial [Gemmatimonadales bacterium]|nr:hypothetical protein [Gemmatimonadales bacterium]
MIYGRAWWTSSAGTYEHSGREDSEGVANPAGSGGQDRLAALAREVTLQAAMLVLARTITYATLFIAVVLLYLPARVLHWAGVGRPPTIGAPQAIALAVGAVGAAIALWCVFAFALVGRGTPAP